MINGAVDLDPELARIAERAQLHLDTWSDKPELYWLGRLIQEVSELTLALTGSGEHHGDKVDSPDEELVEIASIAINWLRHRQAG